jgi:dTDP-glucose 4,6-dehydratase
MNQEKFFVIGSNSFSGASFVDYLLQQGATVTGFSRSAESASGISSVSLVGQRRQFSFCAMRPKS